MTDTKPIESALATLVPSKGEDLAEFAKANNVKWAVVTYVNLLGQQMERTKPIADVLKSGAKIAIDGSSVNGWQGIDASDLVIKPRLDTAYLDPFSVDKHPVLRVACATYDPITDQPYELCPVAVANRAEAYLGGSTFADSTMFGPEPEFTIVDNIAELEVGFGNGFIVNSREGLTSNGDNRSNIPRPSGSGYDQYGPDDEWQTLRLDICSHLQAAGLEVEVAHHEVASSGQCEIGVKYAGLLQKSHEIYLFKYLVAMAAKSAGAFATFIPKLYEGDNGSGMHVHLSMMKNGENIFADSSGTLGLSQTALHAIGGILKHAPALIALGCPISNSYKRLTPGFEAPVTLAYASRNRSAAIRVPAEGGRFEFRSGDPAANPYLYFSALQMAMIDGIKNSIDPGEAATKDLYDLPAEELSKLPSAPANLGEALDALNSDREFLLAGGVFTDAVLDSIIDYRREELAEESIIVTRVDMNHLRV